MAARIFDLEDLYQRTFGTKPVLNGENLFNTEGNIYTDSGSTLQTQYLGKELWLPVEFLELPKPPFAFSSFILPHCVVRVTGKTKFIETPMLQRRGTVKEFHSLEDYDITIKGFLIDEITNMYSPERNDRRRWPEKQLEALKYLLESGEPVLLNNALTDAFLFTAIPSLAQGTAVQKVVVRSLDLPEVEGGRKHVRPFSMTLSSDSIFTLELEQNGV